MLTIVGAEAAVFVDDVTFDVVHDAFPAAPAQAAGCDGQSGLDESLKGGRAGLNSQGLF